MNSQKWDGTSGREGIQVLLARETRSQSHCGMANRLDGTVSRNLVKELVLLCKLFFSRLTSVEGSLGHERLDMGY